jgi:apolipoprotein N-acyltransferase
MVFRMFPALQHALLFLFGAACVLGFAPFNFFPLPILALAALVLAVHADSPRHAALKGFFFGLGLFLAGVSWVYVSLHDFGGMAAPVAVLFTLLFCAYLAVFPALSAYLCARVRGMVGVLVAFPAAWTVTEWTRGWLLSGFPWLSMGYSQMSVSPLRGFAPLAGVFGVSLSLTMCSGALAAIVLRWRRDRTLVRGPGLWLAVSLLAIGALSGQHRWTNRIDDEALTVSLIQGNIPQDLKWQPERVVATLDSYRDMTLASQARLIVLPETALPLFDVELPRGYLDQLAAHARSNGGDVLLGIPEYSARGEYFNSVISVGTATSQNYRKSHLVPFGDYFPMRPILGWIMELLHIPMSSFSRGDPAQRPLQVAGQQIAINICYEDVFGDEIIRQLPEATMLANFTNDAWWGRSVASEQHLQMAQMRSLETGRFMLRATNTGVTAIIDASGNIAARAPEFAVATLNSLAYGYRGTTPYVVTGNWLVILLSIGLYFIALHFHWKTRRGREHG